MSRSAGRLPPELLVIDEELTLVPTDESQTWFRIERLVHDGVIRRDEFTDEKGCRYGKYYDSARLDPYTCYEGSASDMMEMLAVLAGDVPMASQKRIAVQRFPYHECHCSGFIMESPRNSNEVYSYLSMEVAHGLVGRMLLVLSGLSCWDDKDKEYLEELKSDWSQLTV